MTSATIIRDVPLSKLVPSERNVRRTHREIAIEGLAASIAAHGLLQSLSVRPVLDKQGAETGKYAVCGGGRRLAALKLLAKRKEIAKNYPVPCIVSDGDEEEVSLAENVMRVNLHPADQFEAFKRLAEEQGLGAEEIAARFGLTAHVVRQRLRLGAVSPKLMQIYRDGGLTMDQLMAFAITEDHARQEQVYDSLPWNREPSIIRRTLMEGYVRGSDRRAVFVGTDAYQAAGGEIIRDLFAEDGSGYFADAGLLDRLAGERLAEVAAELQAAEGWKWVKSSIDYPHAHGLARHYPQPREPSPEEGERLAALQAELAALNEQYDGVEELSDEADAKFGELEVEIERLSERQHVYAPDVIARGGAFVVLGHDGTLRIERGFVHPEDEPQREARSGDGDDRDDADDQGHGPGDGIPASEAEDETDDGKPLPDSLIRDLTAHRTLGLRLALGEQPEVALIAVTHALAAQTFYPSTDSGTCLELRPTSTPLGGHAEGIEDSVTASVLAERHQGWAARLPQDVAGLWDFVAALGQGDRLSLLAHCAGLTVFAVRQPWERRPRALATADRLAQALDFDMTAHWVPTVRSYLGRVTKARIIEAVRESVSEAAAERIADMKKLPMAEAAEQLLAGTGWVPVLLRTPAAASDEAEQPMSVAAE
ncbi:ParB/RepB/Spo0J family partition protein [Desertibaculum subflavum]|uniref:ParB/RepB/Spo0J family partition protein n=1 Tax=Desertibaculum subflavum TaxID=2268458 RepID=UPI000E674174